MNTTIKNKILAGAMLFSALWMGSSCEDSIEGLKVTPETPYADKTLYEVLKNDKDLTDFMEVVNSCGPECADSLFNHSRVYTVWAPMNDSFDKEALLEAVKNGRRDFVFNTFVKSHVANFLKPANGNLDENNKVLLLNEKMASFQGNYKKGYYFTECKVEFPNVRVKNGLIHKLAGASEYRYNIWEWIGQVAEVKAVKEYLFESNDTTFNEGRSIKGPVVDGEQTYLDSAFDYDNKWLSVWNKGIGKLNAEDSVYTVYFPTNELWEEKVAEAEGYFKYDRSEKNVAGFDAEYVDELTKFNSRYNILKYLTYSNLEQKYAKTTDDSIMPAGRDGKRRKFPKAKFNDDVIVPGSYKELSNGYFYAINKLPFTPIELWHDTVFVEAENVSVQVSNDATRNLSMSVTEKTINKNPEFKNSSISGNYYHFFEAANSKIEVTFAIPNLLSAKYRLALILVPKNITDNTIPDDEILPVRLSSVYVEQNATPLGDAKNVDYDGKGVDTLYISNPKSRDGLYEFPTCEYYNLFNKENCTTRIRITTYRRKSGGKEMYDPSLRLDKIMLIPVLEE